MLESRKYSPGYLFVESAMYMMHTVYQGIYGIRIYQLNNNLSVGTAGYSERSFNEYLVKSGINRQTNYGSSLFVGYKFSDKFSISASFTFRRNGDRFNRNQGMLNGSFFP